MLSTPRSWMLAGGTMLALLVGGRFLVWPWIEEQQGQTEKRIEELRQPFDSCYSLKTGRPLYVTTNECEVATEVNRAAFDEIKKKVEWSFPDWTIVPPEQRDQPGMYYYRKYFEIEKELRLDAENLQRERGQERDVIITDIKDKQAVLTLGFVPDARVNIDLASAEQSLRKLSLMDHLIRLAMSKGVKSIVKVLPLGEEETGLTEKVELKNGHTTTRVTHKFIRLHRVQLEMVTDYGPLLSFLDSVRSKENQYLAITRITVISKPVANSEDIDSVNKEKANRHLKTPEELYVTIEAAGMHFYTPEEEKTFGAKGVTGKGGGQQTLDDLRKGPKANPLGY